MARGDRYPSFDDYGRVERDPVEDYGDTGYDRDWRSARRGPDPRGSEVGRDEQRFMGGPRYHGGGWDRADHEREPRGVREPLHDRERRRAQGAPRRPNTGRIERRYGEAPMDDGELHRYRGGWDRSDDRRWSGRGMGGDFYGGPDRGYDSLIPPFPEERGRYDAGRFDLPDDPRAGERYRAWSYDHREVLWDDDDRRRGGVASGPRSGFVRRR